MRCKQVVTFLEQYLYSARGHRAHEQSVYAEGGRRGFSEARLRRAGSRLGIDIAAEFWELPLQHSGIIDAQRVDSLTPAATALALALAVRAAPLSE